MNVNITGMIQHGYITPPLLHDGPTYPLVFEDTVKPRSGLIGTPSLIEQLGISVLL